MNLSDIFDKSVKTLKTNSPEILTALGVSGLLSTSYLAGKASFDAAKILVCDERYDRSTIESLKDWRKRRRGAVWKLYIPAGVSGALTVGCIIGASKTNSRRTTAAVTAYSLTERAFSEYREKVVEQIGKGKDQAIFDEIAQERVAKDPPVPPIVITGGGHVLCCELFTQRYFRSDMEKLRKAVNELNAKLLRDDYVSMDEFYDFIGLARTSNSHKLGWESGKLLELRFSTVLSENDEPCLAFEYNYTKPLK